ncbi:hypothetical protein Gogos_012824, partial [Gossypium gossypioides]|nr:hypothetical protein [Gossypium gossypioides]
MEEVLGNISLASLNDHPAITPTTNPSSFPSLILQDFLPIPINKEMPPIARSSFGTFLIEETTLFGSLPSTPATLFTLNARSIASVASQSSYSIFPFFLQKKKGVKKMKKISMIHNTSTKLRIENQLLDQEQENR